MQRAVWGKSSMPIQICSGFLLHVYRDIKHAISPKWNKTLLTSLERLNINLLSNTQNKWWWFGVLFLQGCQPVMWLNYFDWTRCLFDTSWQQKGNKLKEAQKWANKLLEMEETSPICHIFVSSGLRWLIRFNKWCWKGKYLSNLGVWSMKTAKLKLKKYTDFLIIIRAVFGGHFVFLCLKKDLN